MASKMLAMILLLRPKTVYLQALDTPSSWPLTSHYMDETMGSGSAALSESDPLVHLFNMLKAAFG